MELKDKIELHSLCIYNVEQKLNRLDETKKDLEKALREESKSSVGDKHETSRAMLHIEQENLASQIRTAQQALIKLQGIKADHSFSEVKSSSLFRLNDQWYYMSVALGQVKYKNQVVFCISEQSPIAQILLNKTEGERLEFQGRNFTVKAII